MTVVSYSSLPQKKEVFEFSKTKSKKKTTSDLFYVDILCYLTRWGRWWRSSYRRRCCKEYKTAKYVFVFFPKKGLPTYARFLHLVRLLGILRNRDFHNDENVEKVWAGLVFQDYSMSFMLYIIFFLTKSDFFFLFSFSPIRLVLTLCFRWWCGRETWRRL